VSRIAINKRKIRINLILKRSFIFLSIIFLLVYLFFLFQSNNKKSFFIDYIQLFSNQYNYLFIELEVTGLNNISKKEIDEHLKDYRNESIFLIPTSEIAKKIKKNPWIKSLSIKNNFRNKIIININEFDPMAIYFNGKDYLLIDEKGNIIDYVKEKKFNKLIVLKGKNSNIKAIELIKFIPANLKSIFIEANYINNRRWNIYTKEKLLIKLPEIKIKEAINIFNNIYFDLYKSDITDIEYIDLRIPKKMIIKYYNKDLLTP
tara:strand:- start:1611 stop:2393 length:783 start_codon:yes stop_codon:yes gene_type:complete